jgi:class 3 adenylate cyclase
MRTDAAWVRRTLLRAAADARSAAQAAPGSGGNTRDGASSRALEHPRTFPEPRSPRRRAAGLHTGQCELAGGGLRGAPLELAASVAAAAATGEVLVSSTVRDLVAGSGTRFREHGAIALPGSDGEARWQLFATDDAARTGDLPQS